MRSFVWHGRDVDVGDTWDAGEREAFLLITAYLYAVPAEAHVAPPAPPVAMTVAYQDPAPTRRRRRGVA